MAQHDPWAVIPEADGPYHVIPIWDMRNHTVSEACWCRPQRNEEGTLVHNSMDRREEYERGERKAS